MEWVGVFVADVAWLAGGFGAAGPVRGRWVAVAWLECVVEERGARLGDGVRSVWLGDAVLDVLPRDDGWLER